MRDLLSAETVESELAALDGWTGDTTSIMRTVAVDADRREKFLADLEVIAREMDHDPDIDYPDGLVQLTMSTHSAGGVTELDVEYARRANVLITQLGG